MSVIILEKADYEMIKQFALKEYLDKPYSDIDEKVHLAKCYATATINYLLSKGYIIQKKDEK